jgi:hypothetical protein
VGAEICLAAVLTAAAALCLLLLLLLLLLRHRVVIPRMMTTPTPRSAVGEEAGARVAGWAGPSTLRPDSTVARSRCRVRVARNAAELRALLADPPPHYSDDASSAPSSSSSGGPPAVVDDVIQLARTTFELGPTPLLLSRPVRLEPVAPGPVRAPHSFTAIMQRPPQPLDASCSCATLDSTAAKGCGS